MLDCYIVRGGNDDSKTIADSSSESPDDSKLEFTAEYAGWNERERAAMIQVVEQVDRRNVGLLDLAALKPVMTPAFYHILGLREGAKSHEEDSLEKQFHQLESHGPVETSALLAWFNTRLNETLDGPMRRSVADADSLFNRVGKGGDASVAELVSALSMLPKLLKALGIARGNADEPQNVEVTQRLTEKFGQAQTITKKEWNNWATIQIRLQQNPISEAVAQSSWGASLNSSKNSKKKKIANDDGFGKSTAPPTTEEAAAAEEEKKKKKQSKMCRSCCV